MVARLRWSRCREEPWSPTDNLFVSLVHLPIAHAVMTNTHDFTHALRAHTKRLMAQEATNVFSGLIVQHIKPNQTITSVAQLHAIKSVIAREEGRTVQCMEQRDDVIAVFHSRAPDFH